jgi:isoquinoline 1-oxidoreductase beta subunit
MWPGELLAADEAGVGTTANTTAGKWSPSVYLGIEEDGTVILVTHRSEMGTGIRSVLPAIMAEELDADWSRVKVEQALGDRKYGSQNTDGSGWLMFDSRFL